jgi:hypothetical protein
MARRQALPRQLGTQVPVLRSAYFVQDELVVVHERLRNWGMWSKDRGGKASCRSIEHNYRPELVSEDDDQTARRKGGSNIDVPDALQVYACVISLELRARLLVNMFYVHRSPIGFINRKLKFSGDSVIDSLNSCRWQVKRMLDNGH